MAVTWDSSAVDAKVRAGALRAVVAATEEILAVGNGLIASPPKTGRIYKRRGVVHQASAPGEAPASDTGALIASSQTILPAQLDLLQIQAFANWSTVYARWLELGDENFDPRPYARPALDLVGPAFPGYVRGEIEAALK